MDGVPLTLSSPVALLPGLERGARFYLKRRAVVPDETAVPAFVVDWVRVHRRIDSAIRHVDPTGYVDVHRRKTEAPYFRPQQVSDQLNGTRGIESVDVLHGNGKRLCRSFRALGCRFEFIRLPTYCRELE